MVPLHFHCQLGRHSPSKVKDELSFDSGDDLLPGMDESPRQTPTSTGQTSGAAPRRRERKTKAGGDLFGDDDGLFGIVQNKKHFSYSV
jgi:hypothetical protein